jgi:hypothetical protein
VSWFLGKVQWKRLATARFLQQLYSNEHCIGLIADHYQDSKYYIPFILRPDTEPKAL